MQLTHYDNPFLEHKFPIVVICDNVNNAPNIGSLFRICDAFGVEKIVFCGENLPIPSRKMQKTARSTSKYVAFERSSDIEEVITIYKKTHNLFALEITESSIPIHKLSIVNKKPIAIIIGDENFGVSDDVLKHVNQTIHIDMFGKNSSMNVVQATNIALYEITKQFTNLF